MQAVTGRFAPTPSGRLHLGNILCAMLAYLSARSQGGRFLLRIEDIDIPRCPAHLSRRAVEDLRWLGFTWDEEPWVQSQRGEIYQAALDRLTAMGLTYPCFCTRAQLHASAAPNLGDTQFIYPGTCAGLSPEEVRRLSATRSQAIRLRTPEEEFAFTDGLYGPQRENLARDCGDFVLRRSDGLWGYQLAVVVDDGLMGVNQVVRGRDLLSSTPWQLWLQEQLGFQRPEYCHVPLLVAAEGRRLSKRDGDMDLGAIRASGVTPQSLVGRLAFLAGIIDREEPVTPEELIPLFRWEKVRKENIVVK